MSGSGIVGIEQGLQAKYSSFASTLYTIAASDVSQWVRKRRKQITVPTDAAASTLTAERGLFYFDVAGSILSITLLPGAALTADDTNYKTLTISKWTAAGGSQTTIAQWITKITAGTGDWTQMVAVTATTALTSATSLAAGVGISYAVTKAGTGVVLPGLCLDIVYTED